MDKIATCKELTAREAEVMSYVLEGMTNAQIAEKMFITKHTVKAHISKILEKLCVKDRIQAAVKATKENMIFH